MQQLVNKLQKILPEVTFAPNDSFFWSPQKQVVNYVNGSSDSDVWALLHEASHALLDHETYTSDYELLCLEVAAWEEAKKLGQQLHINIDENHIQDCLDTYRDWLHQRSTCPTCSSVSLQKSVSSYRCHNCHTEWHVSNSRFCRPYRLRKPKNTEALTESSRSKLFDS